MIRHCDHLAARKVAAIGMPPTNSLTGSRETLRGARHPTNTPIYFIWVVGVGGLLESSTQSPYFIPPRLRGLFFVRGLLLSRGILGPAGPNRIKAANYSGPGRDHDPREHSSYARPGPVALSKKYIRKYHAQARRTGSRAVRSNAVRDTPDATPGDAIPLAYHCAAPGRSKSDVWRARSVDSGRVAANRAPKSDQLRRSGQFPDATKSLGKLLTLSILWYIFRYTNRKPPGRAKG